MVWTGGDPGTSRRGFIAGAVGSRRGGLPGRRGDQEYAPPVSPAAPGSKSNVFKRIIVPGGGPGAGIFVYSGTPKLGNPPVLSIVAPGTTTDPYGNALTSVLVIGSFAAANARFDSSGRLFFSDSAGHVRISVDPGVSGADTTIKFFNAFGAVTMLLDPTSGGFYQYSDTGSSTQGPLNLAAVTKSGNDPIDGTAAGGSFNLYGNTFLGGGLINFDPNSANFCYFSTQTLAAGIGLILQQNVVNSCWFALDLPLRDALTAIHPGTTATPETQQTPVLAANWATGSAAGGFQAVQYRLTVEGEVEISGIVHSTAAIAAGATIWTMPSGYIPATSARFGVDINNNAGGVVAGLVSVASGTGVVTLTLPALAGASEDVHFYRRYRLS